MEHKRHLIALLTFIIAVELFNAQNAPVILELLRAPLMGYFFPDSNIQLTCNATASDPLSLRYSWRLNGVIQENETAGALKVSRATASNAGFYECLASNEWGTAISQSVSMTVAYIDEFTDRTTEELPAAPNGAAVLVCRGKPDSKPPASYSWRRFTSSSTDPVSNVLTSSQVQIDQSTGNLYFANVPSAVASDTLLYGCAASINVPGQRTVSVYGSFYNLIITGTAVTFAEPSEAFRNPKETTPTIYAGEQAMFECFFYGMPTPAISWLRSSTTITGQTNTIYTIDRVSESDNAVQIRCQGKNTPDNTNTGLAFTPIVAVRPVFNSSDPAPRNTNATLGDTVSFGCSPQASRDNRPQSYDVVWYINGSALDENNLPQRYSLYQQRQNLTIIGVTKGDSGSFTCKASNVDGTAMATGALNILEPTVVSVPPTNQSVPEGQTAAFECTATSDPTTPIQFSWIFNGVEINRREINSVCDDTSCTSRLTIQRVNEAMRGFYECQATNSYSVAVSGSAYLEILPAPFSVADIWWVFLIVGLVLVLILVLILCYCYCKDNDGDAYPVDELENKNGNNPTRELRDKGFQTFEPPPIDQVWSTGGVSSSYYGTNSSKPVPYGAVSTPNQTVTNSRPPPVLTVYSPSRVDTDDSSSTLSHLEPSHLAPSLRPRTAVNTLGLVYADNYQGRTPGGQRPDPYYAISPTATGYDVGPQALSSYYDAADVHGRRADEDGDEWYGGRSADPYFYGNDERPGESSV